MRRGFGHAHWAQGSQVLASLAGEALDELGGLGSSLLDVVRLVAAGGHASPFEVSGSLLNSSGSALACLWP
jgi:hypothetical protein